MGNSGFVKKFFQFSYGNLVNLLLGFITAPVLTRIFLPADYGMQSLFTTVLNFLLILVLLGFDQSFLRFFYKVPEEERPGLTRKLTKWSSLASFAFGIIFFALGGVVVPAVFDRYDFWITIFISINLVLGALNRFLTLAVRVQQHAKTYSNIQIIAKVTSFLLMVAFAFTFGANVYAILFATTVSALVVAAYSCYKEREYWHKVITDKTPCNSVSISEIIKYGLPFVPNAMMVWLMNSVDKLSLSAWSGLEQVGIYSAANTFIVLLTLAQTSFTTFWYPVVYEKYEKNPDEKAFFIKAHDMMAIIMFTVTFGLIFFRHIIALLLGKNYWQAADVMPFLIFMPLYTAISDITAIGINIKGKSRYHLLITGVAAVLNISGNMLLIPKYGAIGAATATGISYIVYYAMRTIISEKFMKIGFDKIKITISTIILIIVAYLSSYLNLSNLSYGIIAGAYLIVLFIYRKEVKWVFGYAKSFLIKPPSKNK